MNDYLATTLIVETGRKTVSVALKRALTLAEIWNHFVGRGRRPALTTLSKGVARVTF